MERSKKFLQQPTPIAEIERQIKMRMMYERIARGNALIEVEMEAGKRK